MRIQQILIVESSQLSSSILRIANYQSPLSGIRKILIDYRQYKTESINRGQKRISCPLL